MTKFLQNGWRQQANLQQSEMEYIDLPHLNRYMLKRNCEMPNIQEYSLSYLPSLLSFNFPRAVRRIKKRGLVHNFSA